jgi:signal transduction histidine kinase
MGGEIGISTSRCREKVLLKISNQGEPIPEETLEKAFVPFFTTKPKGTGLGLGLVKRVIEEHDGEVTITSDPVNGTVVLVRLSLPTGI